jgi:DNA polymerase-3 subunit beta
MKAIVKTDELKKALEKVNLSKKQQTLPVLSYAHAKLANGKMVITTSDLQKAIRVEVDSSNSEDYAFLLPRHTLYRFLYSGKNTLTNKDTIILNQDTKTNVISAEREKIGKVNLYTPQEKVFPPIPYADKLTWHTFDSKWFCRMLKIVSHACAKEESRPVLTGVVFKDGTLASADGFRLAVLNDKKLAFGLGEQNAIVHYETVDYAIKLFAKEDKLDIAFEWVDDSSFSTSKEPKPKVLQRIYFKSGNTSLMSELVMGNFPNYEQLIPKTYNCKASFSTPLMIQRLNMIDIKDVSGGILRLIFHKNEQNEEECLIQSKLNDEFNNDAYNYNLSLPIKLLSTDMGKIGVNHTYLSEAIKPFSMCEVELINLSSPIKITGDIEGLTIIVMPMFLQW